MQIPSIHSLFSAKLAAVGLPASSAAGFEDVLDTAVAEGAGPDQDQTLTMESSLGGRYYAMVPNVHYTLSSEAAQATTDDSLSGWNDAARASSLGASLGSYAIQFVGNPYVWGGEDPVNGADCSGFTQTIYRTFGMNLPRTAYRQSLVGRQVDSDQLQPGDLLCFQNADETQVGHVGIYLGGGKFVHSANSKLGIIVSDLSKWTDRLKTVRRMPELDASVG